MDALTYAKLAQLSYSATPDIGQESSASRAIVRRTNDGLTIAFPGTDNVSCWLDDLDIETVEVDGLGRLHAGFWSAWQAIADDVVKAVGNELVIFTGHSLGAALAILAGAALSLQGKSPIAVMGFEPPRVTTDTTIAQLFVNNNVPTQLYRNGEDIVPLVPSLTHPWQHPAPLIQIGKASLPVPNVEDHMIERVIEALSQETATST